MKSFYYRQTLLKIIEILRTFFLFQFQHLILWFDTLNTPGKTETIINYKLKTIWYWFYFVKKRIEKKTSLIDIIEFLWKKKNDCFYMWVDAEIKIYV